MVEDVEIIGFTPGAIGRVVALHGTWYADNTGFGRYFEAKVARLMAAFFDNFKEGQDGFWQAFVGESFAGSVTIQGHDNASGTAQLRFFVVDPAMQGKGIGLRLMTTAMEFCDKTGFERVRLGTFAGLDAARHLYERFGFRLIEETEGRSWGVPKLEQTFERRHGGQP